MYDFRKTADVYFNTAVENRKYLLIYTVLVIVATLSMMKYQNYIHPVGEGIVFALSLISGIFCILYYFMHGSELYKVAFVVILCFGLVCAFLSPICLVPDEQEHLIRSDLTSHGELIPQYIDNSYYNVDTSAVLVANAYGNTIFNFTDSPLDLTTTQYHSAFAQNPFYGYLVQGLGILIVELLNLSSIWMLWMGRIFNLVLYALLVSIAVRKTPVLKTPFIAVACLPLTLLQAASVSIDVCVNGLSFIIIAYFFYMIYSKDYSLDEKDILIFSLLTLLLTLTKLPYLAFIFLLVFVPKNKFKTPFYYNVIAFVVVAVIGVLWSQYWATPNYLHSYRAEYYIANNVSLEGQVNYLTTNWQKALITISSLPNYLGWLLSSTFLFSFPPFNYESGFLNALGPMFLGALIFLYPVKTDKKMRLNALFVILIVFIGLFMIQLLTWSTVGKLWAIDVQARYLIPLLILLPFTFSINNDLINIESVDNYVILVSIAMMAILNILTAVSFY